MQLNGICLITEDVPRLVDFYRRLLGVEPVGDEIHTLIDTGEVSMAIYSKAAARRDMKFDFSRFDGTGRFSLMFRVENVDREYERIKPFVKEFVAEPMTYPWGSRSVHFRDPDGNLVDFYSPPLQ